MRQGFIGRVSMASGPRFYPDRLVFRLRTGAAQQIRRGIAMVTGVSKKRGIAPLSDHCGLALLDQLDQSGLIKRMTCLDAHAESGLAQIAAKGTRGAGVRRGAGLSRGLRAMAAIDQTLDEGADAAATQPTAMTGMQMLQATDPQELQRLKAALGDDPAIEFVSEVPLRWLAAVKRKTPSKPPASRSASSAKVGKRLAPAGRRQRSGAAAPASPPLVMWNLQKILWSEARDAGFNAASKIRVGVLDTGVDLNHPDLPGKAIDYTYDFGAPGASASDRDIIGHGTHVLGTIGALAHNDIGINGICKCRLSCYKIFSDEPELLEETAEYEIYDYFVDPEMYHLALAKCVDDKVRVVNLSIGGFEKPSKAEEMLFKNLDDNGIVVVSAMGNENSSQPSYPAAIPAAIAVGASLPNDARAGFSNKGKHITLLAPGENIWSTLPTYPGESTRYKNKQTDKFEIEGREIEYGCWPGTSMATPHVSAACALILQANPKLKPAEVKQLLIDHADKVPAMKGAAFTTSHGHGRLNLLRLAEAVR